MKKFKQISIKKGFMMHNGGLLLRDISKTKYEFKTKIKRNHLNRAGITHGGYIASIIDTGCGSGANRISGNQHCVTITLNINFIGPSTIGDEIFGYVKIKKKTKSMVFLECYLKCKGKIIASATGIWKILQRKLPHAGLS